MALRKSYTYDDENGDSVSVDGYFRVREVHTQYEKDKDQDAVLNCSFQLETYDYNNIAESVNGEQLDRNIIASGVVNLPTECVSSGVSSLTVAAYHHLKTLEIFDGAEDC